MPSPAPPVVFDTRVVTGSGGGPDKTILNSPRFLAPLGYRMVCGYLHPPDDPGFEVLRAKAAAANAPLVSIPDRGPWDWTVVRALLDVCRREKVAIYHGHDYKTNLLGLLLKRFHPMRLVTTVHGWVRNTARTPLYYRLDRWSLPKYERVVCVSDDLFAECRQSGVPAKRLMLLENAIDGDEYRRTRTAAEARSVCGLPADGLLVGAVGRLSAEKGFDVLLRAVRTLLERHVDVRCVIVGDGAERAALEALIAESGLTGRVFLPGWRADVRAYYEAMDVYALSSHREGLPNVVLEAMALEVPVVATAVNGVPRLVQDGRNGVLVKAGDAAGLADALAGLLADPARREALKAAGRQTVETRYAFSARMAKMAALYDELLRR